MGVAGAGAGAEVNVGRGQDGSAGWQAATWRGGRTVVEEIKAAVDPDASVEDLGSWLSGRRGCFVCHAAGEACRFDSYAGGMLVDAVRTWESGDGCQASLDEWPTECPTKCPMIGLGV